MSEDLTEENLESAIENWRKEHPGQSVFRVRDFLFDESSWSDGIALGSVSHPKRPWWRFWELWFHRIKKDSQEIVEIELPERKKPL